MNTEWVGTWPFHELAKERGYEVDYDLCIDVTWISIPDGPVIGIDDSLNEPGMFECVVYGRATEDEIERGFCNFLGATERGYKFLDDIPNTTPHAEALDAFIRAAI